MTHVTQVNSPSSYTEIFLADGNRLRFKLPMDLGNHTMWFRTRYTCGKIKKGCRKQSHPLTDGRTGKGKYRLLFLDIDGNAASLFTFKDWAEAFPHGLIIRTPSGNLKAVFQVSLAEGATDIDCYNWLANQLPEEWVSKGAQVDMAGMDRCFVTDESWLALAEWAGESLLCHINASCPASPVQRKASKGARKAEDSEAGSEEDSSIVSGTENSTSFSYYTNPQPLTPELEKWVKASRFGHQIREGLIRILSAAWNLNTEKGFQLPLKCLAKQLNTSVSMVSGLLSELKKAKLLKCTNHSYIPGVRAKTYVAGKHLFQAIQKHKAMVLASRTSTPKPKLQVAPQKGERYLQLLPALAPFSSVEKAVGWVQSLPGCTPDHVKIVEKIMKCQIRKRAA
jgi:hypothetical protein